MPLHFEDDYIPHADIDAHVVDRLDEQRTVYMRILASLQDKATRMKAAADKLRSNKTIDTDFVKLRTGHHDSLDKNMDTHVFGNEIYALRGDGKLTHHLNEGGPLLSSLHNHASASLPYRAAIVRLAEPFALSSINHEDVQRWVEFLLAVDKVIWSWARPPTFLVDAHSQQLCATAAET